MDSDCIPARTPTSAGAGTGLPVTRSRYGPAGRVAAAPPTVTATAPGSAVSAAVTFATANSQRSVSSRGSRYSGSVGSPSSPTGPHRNAATTTWDRCVSTTASPPFHAARSRVYWAASGTGASIEETMTVASSMYTAVAGSSSVPRSTS